MNFNDKLTRVTLLSAVLMALALSPAAVIAKKSDDTTKVRLDALESDVAGLTSDVGSLQADTGKLQTDVSGLQADTTNLQTGIADLQTDVENLESSIGGLDTDVGLLQAGATEQGILNAALSAALEDLNNDLNALGTDTAALNLLTSDQATLISDLQHNVQTVTTLATAQTGQIAALQANNALQNNQIGRLARQIRLGATREQLKDKQALMAERARKIRKLIWLDEQGLMPETLPGLMLVNEINYYLDIAEKIRCSVTGIDTTGYDCMASDEEEIIVDEYVLPEDAQVVIEEVPILIEYGVETIEVTLEEAIAASTSEECLLYKDDPDNDFKYALCTYTLEVETSEAMLGAYGTSIAANVAGNTAETQLGSICDPVELNEAELAACEGGYELLDNSWQGLTVPGEDPIPVPADCVMSEYSTSSGVTAGCP